MYITEDPTAGHWENRSPGSQHVWLSSWKSVFLKVWQALEPPGRFMRTQTAEPHPLCQFTGLEGGTRIWISSKFLGDVDPMGFGSMLENDSLSSYPLKGRKRPMRETHGSEPSLGLWLSYDAQLISVKSQAMQFNWGRLFPSLWKSKINKLNYPWSWDGGCRLWMLTKIWLNMNIGLQ